MVGHWLRGSVVFAVAVGLSAFGPRQASEALALQPAQQARGGPAGGITWDFETGTLAGWQATGNAFSAQPTLGDNTAARQAGPANQQGRYWIGTFERYQGPGRGTPGGTQGDRPQGTLTSIPFTIPQTLTFRIGGGSAIETRVELLLLDQIEGEVRVTFASGRNSETMQDVSWNLASWAGRQGRIRIVDASSGPWGHINVDDFRFPLNLRGTNILQGGRTRGLPPTATSTVPDLTNSTQQQALQLLENARLRPGGVSRAEHDSTPGTVFSQTHQAGSQVAPGTMVGFSLALPVTVPVPELRGQTQEAAADMLKSVQLAVGPIEPRESTAPPGTVLEQSIGPPTRVARGTAIALTVATPELVSVPRVTGVPVDQARLGIRASRLSVGEETARVTRTDPEGTVLEQRPAAEERVAIGTPVALTVAAPEMVTVPNVFGLERAPALDAIGRAGLTLGDVQLRFSLQPGGTVTAQTIAAGSVVPFGTAISLEEARPWVTWMAPVGTVLLLAAAGIIRARVKKGKKKPAPPIDIAGDPHVDDDDPGLEADGPESVRRDVEILPVMDEGTQEISPVAGDLIRGEQVKDE